MGTSTGISLPDLYPLAFRAKVAFAVRCAQRLRGLFRLDDSETSNQHRAAWQAGIDLAYQFLQGQPLDEQHAAAVVKNAYEMAEATYSDTKFAGYAVARAASATL